jgi:hypothetical protein
VKESSGAEPRVEVTFPADARFLVMARVTVAALAAEIDLDIEAIDDLRIAVDELCVALLDHRDEGADRIALCTTLDGRSLSVEGRLVDRAGNTPAVDGDGEIRLEELSRSIMEVIVDGFELGRGSFRFWKAGS